MIGTSLLVALGFVSMIFQRSSRDTKRDASRGRANSAFHLYPDC